MINYDAWKLQEPPEPVDLECCDQSSDAVASCPAAAWTARRVASTACVRATPDWRLGAL